jgi:AcrR family transcriptional regulator
VEGKQKRDLERRAAIGRERRARTRARIIASAFELLGEENGLYARVEDVSARAGITRPTFYDHFTGMAELRDAVTIEVTHDFLIGVSETTLALDDPRERASAAIRFYLERVRRDRRWGWSMINLSANGIIFGAETFRQAEATVQEGIDAGLLPIRDSRLGRDVILGATLAAMSSILREDPGADYPVMVACSILIGLGVGPAEAREIASRPLPALPALPEPPGKVDKVSATA